MDVNQSSSACILIRAMSSKHFRWPFLALLTAFFIAAAWIGPAQIGASSVTDNGHYVYAAGTAPWALIIASLIIGLYFLLMLSPSSKTGFPLPGVLRRFIAFLVDFALAMISIGSFLGLIPALAEWHRTGVFQWHFQRTSPVPGDNLIAISSFAVAIIGLISYFAWPLVRQRPTPGTCIAGYQVVADDEAPMHLVKAIGRTFIGMYAAGLWIIAPFVARDRFKGKIWLDKAFKTRAVKLN